MVLGIHHTSGLPDYTDLLDVDYEEVTTAQDALDTLAAVQPEDPGTVQKYSNTNYFLLGQIVQAVTGQTLVEYAADEIFTPLGMTHSSYRDDQGTFTDEQAVGYYDNDDGTYSPAVARWRQTGDGAVHTTVADLLLWARLFLDAPRDHGLGSQQWLDLMLTPGPIPDDDGSEYGGGIGLYQIDGQQVLYHGGAWIGVASYLQVQPADGLAVALTCNVDDLDAEALGDEVVQVWTAS